MRTSLFTALTAILSVAVALPTQPTLAKRADPDVFILKPASDAPKEVQDLGPLYFEYNDRFGGKMGWPNSQETNNYRKAELFMQYNAKNGTAFYYVATRLEVYLWATGTDGTASSYEGPYQAKMGNPAFESPSSTRQGNFTLNTVTDGSSSIEYFGFLDTYKDAWFACPENGTYNLYFNASKMNECLPFSLETEHISYTS